MKRVLLLLLLLTLVVAQSTEDAGYSQMKLRIDGYTPKPQTVYVPQNDARQTVDYGKLPVKYDQYENAYLTVEGNYSFIFDVEIDAAKPKIKLDQKFPVTEPTKTQYLQNNSYIESTTPEAIQRALDVTRNSRTVLQAMKDLNLWTNSYLEYDISYWGDILTSSEALDLRKGVCDEYSNVYCALSRSLNLPSRIATGLVYTGSQWQRHAWAETLVGNVWVPTDPTFGEIGLVNALHVKLYHAPNYLFYQFPQSLEDITVLEYTVDDYGVDLVIDAKVSHVIVPPKGAFTLTANITNEGDTILIPTYAAQKTVGVDLLSDFRQSDIIGPSETKTLQWEFVAPFGERETYYVFLVGPRVNEKYAITVDPTLIAEGYSDFEIKNVYASTELDEIVIETEVKNRGSYDFAGVIATVTMELGTQQQSFSLASGESKVLQFKFPAQQGSHAYELKIDAGNSSVNTFGTVTVTEDADTKSVGEAISEFLSEYIGWIYVIIAIIVIGALTLILLVPIQEKRKIPFEEREEWGRLMKLRKGE